MFCTHCGKKNPDGANYCFSCGVVLPARAPAVLAADAPAPARTAAAGASGQIIGIDPATTDSTVGKQCPVCGLFNPGVAERCDCGYSFTTATPSAGAAPPLFPVATHKFIVLSICTFGVYEIYWCYQNWVRLRGANERMRPLARALFAPLWAFQLFGRMQDRVKRDRIAVEWSARGLATVYLVLNFLWRLPDPWWLVSFLTVVPMIPVQQSAQRLNDRYNFAGSRNTGYTTGNVIAIVSGGILLVLSVIGALNGSR